MTQAKPTRIGDVAGAKANQALMPSAWSPADLEIKAVQE